MNDIKQCPHYCSTITVTIDGKDRVIMSEDIFAPDTCPSEDTIRNYFTKTLPRPVRSSLKKEDADIDDYALSAFQGCWRSNRVHDNVLSIATRLAIAEMLYLEKQKYRDGTAKPFRMIDPDAPNDAPNSITWTIRFYGSIAYPIPIMTSCNKDDILREAPYIAHILLSSSIYTLPSLFLRNAKLGRFDQEDDETYGLLYTAAENNDDFYKGKTVPVLDIVMKYVMDLLLEPDNVKARTNLFQAAKYHD